MSSFRQYLPDDQQKQNIKTEVVRRVLYDFFISAREDDYFIRRKINETVSAEIERWRTERSFPLAEDYIRFFRKVRRKIPSASDSERRYILKQIVELYMDEIQGHFSPIIYRLATRIVPRGLSFILASITPSSIISNLPHLPDVDSHIIISGNKDILLKLARKGSIILSPTHVSHVDSPVIGYVVYKVGLPPFLYGAGLNLFSNPILGFFMKNLGAYKVDRKRKHDLYLDTLKHYVSTTLEMEYDHIFFPEGTRSRNGTFPKKLKMGLLGCGVRSYINNLKNKSPRPNIYVVPATFTYHITLEAESLVRQYLEDTTKEDWVSYKDEAFVPSRIFEFVKRFIELDMKLVVRFSDAFDVFGNPVDEDGNSLDPNGRTVDPKRYVLKDGVPEHDSQRDAEYTKELAEKILQTYRKDNAVLSTNLASFVIFELAMKKIGETDEIRALYLLEGLNIDYQEVIRYIDIAKNKFNELHQQNKVFVFYRVNEKTAKGILDTAYRVFSKYHERPPFRITRGKVKIENAPLLYYYRNRLTNYISLY
ncbi:MAG: 1-acyl-sn-glycerol-3-phosphate acyltransferase [bacterium]|nr:1-acyl-sn-glycerol-3-phosphate acyltransferase [bacterium]